MMATGLRGWAIGLTILASVLVARRDAGATDPGDLCTGNPCVISADAVLDPVEVLDFGAATQLRLAAGVELTVAAGTTAATIYVTAGSIILEPGAEIVSRQGTLELDAAAGNIELQSGATLRFTDLADTPPNGPRAELRLNAQGDVVLDGLVAGASGDVLAGVELVDVSAAGRVLGSGRIDVRTPHLNDPSLRPRVQLYATGEIDFSGRIVAIGGCLGGSVDAQSQFGPLALGRLDVAAKGCPAQGGAGIGGSVTVSTAGDARLRERVDARGRLDGGSITLGGDALFVEDRIDARGRYGDGGTLQFHGGDFTMLGSSDIRLAGRNNGTGDVEIVTVDDTASGDATLTRIQAGTITVDTAGAITVQRRLRTKSSAPGPIDLRACGPVSVQAAGILDSRAKGGGISSPITIAGDALDVAGRLRATGATISFDYFTTAPLITGSVEPAPTITQVAPPASCAP